jgi:predicted transcriptional regulator
MDWTVGGYPRERWRVACRLSYGQENVRAEGKRGRRMKAVMMSIQPKFCELIASGKKTVEVRKTKPKIAPPFKVYIYCTKDNTFAEKTLRGFDDNGKAIYYKANKGKVIGEFVCDCITTLYNCCYDEWERLLGGLHRIEKQLVENACLTEKELHSYANGKRCYAWHITDLAIYDEPRELGEFEIVGCQGCRDKDTYHCKFHCFGRRTFRYI